jgi:hypothetical protein
MFTNKQMISSLLGLLLPLLYSAAFILTDAAFAVCGTPGSC